jgi:hypothetical protein
MAIIEGADHTPDAVRIAGLPCERGGQAHCRSRMTPLEAALLVVVLTLPFHFLVQWQLGRQCDPRYLRRHGVVIRREDIVEHGNEIIGRYRGRDIADALVFMGMHYRFAGIVPPAYRVKTRELLLPPGLLYLTD